MGLEISGFENHVIKEWKNDAGELHRVNGPAYIEQDEKTGIVIYESYFVDGKLHRENGPARVWRDQDTGEVYMESYYLNGKLIKSS